MMDNEQRSSSSSTTEYVLFGIAIAGMLAMVGITFFGAYVARRK